MWFIKILFSLLVAQAATPASLWLFFGLDATLSSFSALAILVSTAVSLLIAFPLLVVFLQLKQLNVFSILSTALVATLPFIVYIEQGLLEALFLLPAIIGGVICWGTLKLLKLTDPLPTRILHKANLYPATVLFILMLSVDEVTTYGDLLYLERDSYKTLDQNMIEDIERDRGADKKGY